MRFNRTKRTINKLQESFGKLKDETYNFELIERYFRKKDHSKASQVLSDKICKDLDFEKLFMFIDRTNSKVGQQYLYNTLRTIPSNSKIIHDNEDLIKLFIKDSKFRLSAQRHLEKLKKDDIYNITTLFQEEHLKPSKWFFIIRLLSLTSLLLLIISILNPQFFLVLIGLFTINLAIHYSNRSNFYQYLGSIPELVRLNTVARELYKNAYLRRINQNLPESINRIEKVFKRMLFFRLEGKLNGTLKILFFAFSEFIKTLFLLEPQLLFRGLRLLDAKRKEIENVFLFVGQIDTMISVASLRKGLKNYCIPEVVDNQKTMTAKDIYHPLFADCVENNIRVGNKSILISGSNMSGKTSFIRTIGVNTIAALTINTSFAKYFSLPQLKLHSAIRINDDLMNDKNSYSEELLTVKEMISESKSDIPNLFLVDEIFKGTNTVERISAGKAVLSSLVEWDNIVFASTNDIELADLLKKEYELYHFSEKLDYKTVDFDYKIKLGKLNTRNAIRLLQINDYPDSVIAESLELSKELDKNSLSDKPVYYH